MCPTTLRWPALCPSARLGLLGTALALVACRDGSLGSEVDATAPTAPGDTGDDEETTQVDDPQPEVPACGSLAFNGVNAYVEVPASSDFPSGNDARTVMIWARTSDRRTVDMFTFGSGLHRNSRWSVLLEPDGLKLVGQWNDYWFSDTGWTSWKHMAMVYDGTTLHYYENGAWVESEPVAMAFETSNAYALIIGADSLDRDDEYWPGSLSDLRVWSRALSDAEVAAEYASATADPVGLVGHWAMSEGEGDTLTDSSGNGHDGRLHRATWSTECP